MQITQSAASIERLKDLLDDDLQQRIADENIDLAKILDEVRRSGYAPGPVFQLTKGSKQIEVSLV